MASPGMPAPSDVDALVRTIRGHGLLNKQLQHICTLNGLRANGVKLDLQNRIIDYIQRSVNNPRQFQNLKHSINETQKAGKNAVHTVSYNGNQPSPAAPASGQAHRNMSPYGQSSYAQPRTGQAGGTGQQYRTPQGAYSSTNRYQMPVPGPRSVPQLREPGLKFTESPFYTVEHFVGDVRVLDEMAHHRNTVEIAVRQSDQPHLAQCSPQSNMRVMLFGANTNHGVQDIAFPQKSELKVNGGDVKANMSGLKNKPGSTRPVDLTPHLRLNLPQYRNLVSFTYALTSQKYYIAVCICKVVSVEQLAQDLSANKRFRKDDTIADLRRKAADPDVVATSQKLSLKCPLSFMRLRLPVRGQNCRHLQCFDATSYLQLQEQGPQWRCPVCSKEAKYDSLAVDMYVKEILGNTSDDLDQVTIEPDGRWHTEKDSPSGRSRPSIGASPGVFDDDDIIAILDDKAFSTPFTPARSLGTPGFAASRESSSVPKPSGGSSRKRPAEVIDLTLDSDDDEPSRPVKKPYYGSSQNFLPNSLPPPPPSNSFYR